MARALLYAADAAAILHVGMDTFYASVEQRDNLRCKEARRVG